MASLAAVVGLAAAGLGWAPWYLAAAPVRASPVAREHNISYSEFVRRYAATGTPVVLSGAADSWPAAGLNAPRLRALCGERTLFPPCESDPSSRYPGSIKVLSTQTQGREWGSLAAVPPTARLSTLADLIDAQRDGAWRTMVDGEARSGTELYLHDASIDVLCPALLDELRPPRHFPVDYLQQYGAAQARRRAGALPDCRPGPLGAAPHPSLFVAPAASSTGLHRDAGGTRFWMAVLSGRKKFRLLSPADSLALRARRPTGCDERVRAWLRASGRPELEDDANLVLEACPGYDDDLWAEQLRGGGDGVAVWEAEVAEGDLIFIPQWWAHQVRNLAPGVAVSYNYLDAHSIRDSVALMLGKLELLGLRLAATRGDEAQAALHTSTAAEAASLGAQLDALGAAHAAKRFPTLDASAQPQAPDGNSWAGFFARNRAGGEPAPEDDEARAREAAEWAHAGGRARLLAVLPGRGDS